jgi:very-short-patch-repair endonuclease
MTYIELIIIEWLDLEGVEYQTQYRVANRIADFYLPKCNILIEADGLFWHSERCREDNYHVEKRQIYIDHGYTPLFFREDEITHKFDIIKSIILNKLGRSTRIFARKCNIINIDRETSQQFFNDNHLMGQGRGTTYGLTLNNELVSSIIIKKVRGTRYEISRFCHKTGCQVVGGFSRLVKHFVKNSDAEILTTFIDRRYGSGSYLTGLGFEFINCSPSFSWTNTVECLHRMKFPGNTGYPKGFIKIWDCGQARYDLQT